MTTSVATSTTNAYIVSEKADSALAVEQLPQFEASGQQLLSSITATVDELQAEPTTLAQQASLSSLRSQISQLEDVFTQLPEIAHQLNRAHALLIAQREASMDGILVVDENNQILSINQKFCDFWNVPPELTAVRDDAKMLGHAVSQTANPDQFLDKVKHLYAHPTESSQDELLLKDGRYGDRYSAPAISADGEHFGRVWYFRDITERKRNELTLQQMNEVLETKVQERTLALQTGLEELQTAQTQLVQSEKMAALGNLVSGVAHEVNNPVGFIAGNVRPALDYVNDLFSLIDLYEEQYAAPNEAIEEKVEEIDLDYIREDLPKLIASIKSGAKRIASISNSLRTFSRADTDRPVAFNIHDGLESTLLILKHRLKANDDRPAIDIRTDYADLPAIECYAGQLNQVFMNLLANAIDALEEGEISAKCPAFIEIKTQLLAQAKIPQVQITIRDNGIGMGPEVQQKVFEHLFTTKPVGQGTGLGLAIARQIITEKHQGQITAKSTPGEGTTFTITLPIKASNA
ncbi:MAG: ATP-binding protein [Phormidesmis sp.]